MDTSTDSINSTPMKGILKKEINPKKKHRFRNILKRSTTTVTFQDCVEIREYQRILDHYGNIRPVLALGWKYAPEQCLRPLVTEPKTREKYGSKLALTGKECLDLFLRYGFSAKEIVVYTQKIDLNVCRRRNTTLVEAPSTTKTSTTSTEGKSEVCGQTSQPENSLTRCIPQNHGLQAVDPASLFDVVEVRKNSFDSLPRSFFFELELSTLQTTTQQIESSILEVGYYFDEISRSLQERFLMIISCT